MDSIHTQGRRWNKIGAVLLFLAQPAFSQLTSTNKIWMQSILSVTHGKPVIEGSGALVRFVIITSSSTGETRLASCSASRIGKGIFLTARHCLTPLERKGMKPLRSTSVPGAPTTVSEWDLSHTPLPSEIRGAYASSGFAVQRAFTLDYSNRDVAILVTQDDDGEEEDILPLREIAFESKTGKSCTLLKGYGFHGTETPTWGYFCRAEQVGPPNDFYFFAAQEAPLRCDLPPEELSLSEPGDSGGPLTQVNSNGREEVVGIFSTLYRETGSVRPQAKIDSVAGVPAILRFAQKTRSELAESSLQRKQPSPDEDLSQ